MIQEQPVAKADVEVEGAWGEAVEGVQVRLRAERARWDVRNTPVVLADIRNRGQNDWTVAQSQELCAIEVNGVWFQWIGAIHVKSSFLPPGREYNNIRIMLDGKHWGLWNDKTIPPQPLQLWHGEKRTVRVAFFPVQQSESQLRDSEAARIKVISKPVEIEILPAEAVVDAESDTTSEAEQIDMEGLWGKGGIVEGRGRLDADSVGNVLPAGWQLDYDSGRIPGEGRSWRSGMASDLAELRVVPRPVDQFDLSWKNEEYDFRISSLQGEEMGVIGVAGEIGDAHLTLRPDTYLVEYERRRGKNPDNFKMRCGKFLVDLSRPGMYGLKFSPKLGSAEITGSLDDCYALNFEKVGAGPRIDGLVYQHPPKQYLLDGLLAGKYRLSGVRQRQGDNVFVSRAEVTVKDGERAIADMDAGALGTCSLHGKILGKLSKPRADLRPEFQWFVLIRKPDSPPVTTADAYEALTMDTIYVVRGQNIGTGREEQARYYLEEMAPGKYTATAIEHDLWGGAFITRQQSKPLMIKANKEAVLDFDLEGTENQSRAPIIRPASADESQFVATLPNGVTVELLGIYYGDNLKNLALWEPGGSLILASEAASYRERIVFREWGNEDFKFEYGLLIGFRPLDDLQTDVFVKQGQRMSYKQPRADGIAVALIASDWNDREEGFSNIGNIKVAVARGPWETHKSTARAKEPSVRYLDDRSMIMFSPVRRADEWLLDVTVNTEWVDLDCFYELKDGFIEHAQLRGTMGQPGWIGPNQRRPMIIREYSLAHEPGDIRDYIIKYRQFDVVEFTNVALRPGAKTGVEAKVLPAPPGKPKQPVSPKASAKVLASPPGKPKQPKQPVGPEASKKVLASPPGKPRQPVNPKASEKAPVDKETRRQEIVARLEALEQHRRRVRRDLDGAEQSLQEVRERWGIVDLEDPSGRPFQHTITLRLNNLTLERDRCILEIGQIEARISNLKGRADTPDGKARLKQAQEELVELASKLKQLEQMRQEVEAKQKELDSARIQYGQRLVVRDERRQRLDAIKEQIEKLRIMYDDPEAAEVGRGPYKRAKADETERPDRRLSRQEIKAKLTGLEDSRRRIERELRHAEEAMREVRERWGFADLEERSYPHPVTQRLIRLERQRDECTLEMAQLQAKIGNLEEQADTPEGKANLKKAQEELVVLGEKLKALQEMREQAEAKKRDLDAARVQHKQRAAIRDERKRMLDSIKADIEKWKILHDDPQTPDVPPMGAGR
jgi:hypothetical protein